MSSPTDTPGSAAPQREAVTPRRVTHLVKSQLFMLALEIFSLTEAKLGDGSRVATRKVWEALT